MPNANRWLGKSIASVGVVAAMLPLMTSTVSLLAVMACVALVPWIGFVIPKHGETLENPILMGLRNLLFTALLAGLMVPVFGVSSLVYAPAGALVGVAYWAARRWRDRLPLYPPYIDGWTAWAELGLGVSLVAPLALIGRL
jgi:hypothetical protein